MQPLIALWALCFFLERPLRFSLKATVLAPKLPLGSLLILGLLILATGCATAPLQYSELDESDPSDRSVELTQTPFFAQTAYHCGPSALATVLQTSGVGEANPDQLADQVYIPAQRGSLQTELLGATRRAERIPYVLEPRLEHLLQEVRAGNPVLVLQNLRLPTWPQWHYAVVVGFDLDEETVILRSGTERRQVESLRRFERTWQLGDYWALVVTPPGETPASASPGRYLQAVAALEQLERFDTATGGYTAAAERWPNNPTSFMGLGNIAYQKGRYGEAVIHYDQAITLDPEAPSAHFNLAWAELRRGEQEAARTAARRAEALAPQGSRFSGALTLINEAAENDSND